MALETTADVCLDTMEIKVTAVLVEPVAPSPISTEMAELFLNVIPEPDYDPIFGIEDMINEF